SQGQAGGVGPLEVVDEDQHSPGGDGRDEADSTFKCQRPAALVIHRPALNRPQIFQLGEEINQSGGGTIGECPGGCQVEGKSFAQQGAGQSPRLVSLGQEAPNGEHRQG